MTIRARCPFGEERDEKITELVATAIANAESREELAGAHRRSGRRRRRIERDLHDAAQRRLVTLAVAGHIAPAVGTLYPKQYRRAHSSSSSTGRSGKSSRRR